MVQQGSTPLSSLEHCKAHKFAELKYKAKTVNNHLAVLRGALDVAERWNLIDEVPQYRKLRLTEPTIDFLTAQEASRLTRAAKEPWRTMVVMALYTGMEIGELLALQWDDIANDHLWLRAGLVAAFRCIPNVDRQRCSQ